VLIVLLGGARSGKSRLAVELAAEAGASSGATITFVATCPRIDGDDDLDARIDRHRAERPADWSTVEEPTELLHTLVAHPRGPMIVDCLTLWVSNLLHRGDDPEAIVDAALAFADVARSRVDTTIVVSNEVGLGVHPEHELGRVFRDVLGSVNQCVARSADRALLMVAGLAVPLTDPRAFLR
jgi:adenosylcobinamide kinase / adenosylcobinamide-phosphate guanylyltransferase